METFEFENLKPEMPKVWSVQDIKQFEQGMNELDKDFFKIKLIYLPNKTLASIIDYYYSIWKTSENYIKKRDEKFFEKKKKIIEITEPQSVQLLNLAKNIELCLNEERNSQSSQNNSFESAEDYTENKSMSTLNAKILCSSCLKYKNKFNFDRNSHAILTHASLTHEALDGAFYIAPHQQHTNKGNDRNNNLTYLKQADSVFSLAKSQSSASNFSDSSQTQHQISSKHEQLCNHCWIYWKKYGSFRYNYNESQSSNEHTETKYFEKLSSKTELTHYLQNIVS